MKVGDYVRTEYGIALIENIRDDIRRINLKTNEIYFDYEYQLDKCIIYSVDEGSSYFCSEEDITKSSPNIIDLIEKSDLVVDNYGNIHVVDYVFDSYVYTTTKQENIVKTLCDYQIKSIVTKEQFEAMQYKVGE